MADREPGGAVWAEGTEVDVPRGLKVQDLREAGPRLGWADGRASSDLLSDIRTIRLGERGGTQLVRVLRRTGRTHRRNVSRRGDQVSRVGIAVADLT